MLGLTNAQIKKVAPAAFAKQPHERTSDKYVHVKTNKIIDDLKNLGWFPYSATQSKVKKKENDGTQTHMIRFRREADLDIKKTKDTVITELLGVNGHDGRTRLQFYSGVFRMICGNGMIVMEQDFGGFNIKHIGYSFKDIEQLVINHVNGMSSVLDRISDYTSTKLTHEQKLILALRAHKACQLSKNLEYAKLLTIRREEDSRENLWSTFNIIQENIIKGGIKYFGNKRNTKSRKIESVRRGVNINLTLWGLLNNFYNEIS